VSLTLEEHCLNLQLDVQSDGDCAIPEAKEAILSLRQQTFATECPGQTWNPEAALKKLNSDPTPVICQISPDLENESIDAGLRYPVAQFMIGNEMVLLHKLGSARVKKSVKDGILNLGAELFAENGNSLGKAEKDYVITEKFSELRVSNDEAQLQIICNPMRRNEKKD
jgi:hypothetical protein